ncbi:MAG: peptidyl-alpha-hydroxyglycine alpha-amidating lyase family protein [Woeseia sp.]
MTAPFRSIPGALLPITVSCMLLMAAAEAQNHAPNPYRTIEGWATLPDNREWGASSAVFPAPDGKHIWIADRCGANLCVDSDVDPVLLFDADGNAVKSFGAGIIAWPHGIFVDAGGNVWITDAVGYAPVPDGWGHVVLKFSPDGELLMTLGKKGVAGPGPDTFNKPSDVLVAPNGDIFIADGHDSSGNNRIVKFAQDGTYIGEWGSTGNGDGQFRDPHALAMDSQGRLFVADRGNSRIQIFDQGGKHLATWTQFGRPSGLYIDKDDVLYSTDSESNAERNPGWKRGIRIGSTKDGFVTAFIPDPEPDQDNSGTSGAEGVAVDSDGNVYGAEVGPRAIKKYVRK